MFLLGFAAFGGTHARSLVPRLPALVGKGRRDVEGVGEAQRLPFALGVVLAVYLFLAHGFAIALLQAQIVALQPLCPTGSSAIIFLFYAAFL